MITPVAIRSQRARNQGFSLIEVLVALLVLSIGLLGLAMLQVQGMRANSDAYLRTQATIIAYDLIDRMRINNVAAQTGAYTASAAPIGVTNCETTGGCQLATDRAKWDLVNWYGELANTLPGYQATVSAPSGNKITITISWTQRNLTESQQWQVEL